MNRCTSCKQDFGSVAAFDRHRVGVHAYTFKQGLDLDREDGRRCLDEQEMLASNLFEISGRGTWSLTATLRSAREAFLSDPCSSQGHEKGTGSK